LLDISLLTENSYGFMAIYLASSEKISENLLYSQEDFQ